MAHGEFIPTPLGSDHAIFLLFCAVYLDKHGKVVCRVPEIWHTANSAFAVPVVAVGASSCVTLGEIFAVFLGGFAVCPRHTAKYRN